jgi:DNA-binding transcriptional ArsR family regulator
MSKSIPDKLKGFTPCMANLVKEHGVITSLVYGRVWRYCQGDDCVCSASIEKISTDLKLSYKTVTRHLGVLVKNGYLIDHTPELRNHPHKYSCSNKADIGITVEVIDEKCLDLKSEKETSARSESPSARSESPSDSDFKSDEERKESKKEESPSSGNANAMETNFSEMVKVFNDEKMGFLSPGIAGKIDIYLRDGVDIRWIIEAVHRAGYQNRRTWSYAEAILKNFIVQGGIDDNWNNKGSPYYKHNSDNKPKEIIINPDGSFYA